MSKRKSHFSRYAAEVATIVTPLGRFLTERLATLGISIREFSRRIEISNVFIVRVKLGQAIFPPEQFSKWCVGLELSADKKNEFFRITLIDHSPPEIRDYIYQLEARLARAEGKTQRGRKNIDAEPKG